MTASILILTRAATRAGALALAFLAAGTAQADTHYGIISTVRTSPKTTASFNVVSDTPSEVVFTVFPEGVAEVSDFVGLNAEGFATSANSTNPAIQNLFMGAGVTTALVRAVVANAASGVVLEQSSLEGKSMLAVPPVSVASGLNFFIPIGDLRHGTSMIVGNPGDLETGIVVKYGNDAEEPPRPLSRRSTLVIDVTQANTMVKLTSANPNVPVIALLAVDTGKTTEMTVLMPTSAGGP